MQGRHVRMASGIVLWMVRFACKVAQTFLVRVPNLPVRAPRSHVHGFVYPTPHPLPERMEEMEGARKREQGKGEGKGKQKVAISS